MSETFRIQVGPNGNWEVWGWRDSESRRVAKFMRHEEARIFVAAASQMQGFCSWCTHHARHHDTPGGECTAHVNQPEEDTVFCLCGGFHSSPSPEASR